MHDTNTLTHLTTMIILCLTCYLFQFYYYYYYSPVKVVCSILSISTGWITAAALIASGLIIAANANDMVYFTVKVRG